MGNKILVEFDKKRLKECCKILRKAPFALLPCSVCKQSNKELIECLLRKITLNFDIDYKIIRLRRKNNGK